MRRTRAVVLTLPSPSWTYALLVGDSPGVRLPGWPAMYQQHVGEPAAEQVWAQHQDALIALAAQHGFKSFWETRRPPTGPGFRAWREQFIAEHAY
jgi:hypothetical protein